MDYSKFEPLLGDWGPKLKPIIESPKFDEIYAFLKQQSREGRVICPESKNVFRAFKECPFSELRVVFILQDPYPWIKDNVYVSDGMAMSCSNTMVCQPSLDLFYEGLENDLNTRWNEGTKEYVLKPPRERVSVPHHPDLTYLAKQGILFLNASLSVEKNKSNSHAGRWDFFIDSLIEEVINFYTRGLIYVAFGKEAHKTSRKIIPFLHWPIEVEHPAAAAHSNRIWKHDKMFSKINTVLKNTNNQQISWIYGQMDTLPEGSGGTNS